MPVPPFLRGLSLGLSLIVAIGPQNAFVLRQGLARRHALLAALACSLCDTLLTAVGVLGVGALLARSPALVTAGTLVGAAFLGWYGWRSFRSAHHPVTLDTGGQAAATPAAVIATASAFSLLNPHAILDTVVLIGGASAGLSDQARWAFLGGAVAASWLWFFALALLAGRLTSLMRSVRAWQVLDILIGAMMWVIAAGLVTSLLQK
ncbi:amino acid transporter [Deinococcus sp. SDU3-2]|uniref:Amino acid transporter n=1 Tax=Deinococcus terrestris TaxID=2651870 RepID=A0A7X1NXR5_9DEIO|nr:LysE family transporter [Deinococcus terrestris]MPY67444.1 amino acid transporter [Deinococcus terrestris]